MPFIWYDLTAMWRWRILRAAPLRLRPISTHASSSKRGRNQSRASSLPQSPAQTVHQYSVLLVQVSKVNFERLLTDSETFETCLNVFVSIRRPSPGGPATDGCEPSSVTQIRRTSYDRSHENSVRCALHWGWVSIRPTTAGHA